AALAALADLAARIGLTASRAETNRTAVKLRLVPS
ncbi:MAG: hypothetical protein QOF30_3369, partial [Acidimicrobiaceae bacterium]|nr:hypothetical protein [Acidimicrobiaceae bacterium]